MSDAVSANIKQVQTRVVEAIQRWINEADAAAVKDAPAVEHSLTLPDTESIASPQFIFQ